MIGARYLRGTVITVFAACASCTFDLEEIEAPPSTGSDAYVQDAGTDASDADVGKADTSVADSETDSGDASEEVPPIDGCWPPSDDAFCTHHGFVCGQLETTDECGEFRSVVCGTCGAEAHCDNGNCVNYVYAWVTGAWSSCSTNCGGGTKTRDVHCQRDDGQVVSDSFCGSSKPDQNQPCNPAPCCVTPAAMQSGTKCAGGTSDIPNYHWVQFHFGLDDGSPANQAECAAQCTVWAEMDALNAWCCDLVEDTTTGHSYSCSIHTGLSIVSFSNPNSDGSFAVLGSCQTP